MNIICSQNPSPPLPRNSVRFYNLFISITIVLAFGATVGAEEIISIFTLATVKDSVAEKSLAGPDVPGHQQEIKVQLIPLRENRPNYKKVRMDFLDRSIIVRRTKFILGAKGSSTWFGKPENQAGSVVMSVTGKALFGRIEFADGVYKIEPSQDDGIYRILKLDPGKEVPIDDGGVAPPISELNEAPASPPKAKVQALSTGVDDGSVIDVLVLYTKGFATKYPGDQLAAQINLLIGVANISYSNSQIGLTIRVVGQQEVDYNDDTNAESSLNDLNNGSGIFSGVMTLRNQLGADLVTLLMVFNHSENYCGYGRYGYFSLSPLTLDEKRGFSVIKVGTAADGHWCSDQTLPHEMGHNMGCAHNIEDSVGAVGAFPYSYGYRFGSYSTVMAYTSSTYINKISYFSNPNVSYLGLATGTESANNARTINETKLIESRFRDSSPGSPPTINSFSPTIGWMGTTVTISGTNFYTTPELNSVTFNGVAATVSGASYTSLTVIVPAGATTGPMSISTYRGSVTSSENFTVDADAPTTTASPASGAYASAQTVALTCKDNSGGTGCNKTYYTMDGTVPTTSSPVYSNAIFVPYSTTLKFFSVDTAGNQEMAKTETYTIDGATPTTKASPSGGTYPSDRTVTLTCRDNYGGSGCSMTYCTTNGGTPTTASANYTTPILISSDTVLKFFSVDMAGNRESIETESYAFKVPNLAFYKPTGWSKSIVVSKLKETHKKDNSLVKGDILYLDWAATNSGVKNIKSTNFAIDLYVDGIKKQRWVAKDLKVGWPISVEDYLLGKLRTGTHSIQIKLDATNKVWESNELDNEYSLSLSVSTP